MKIKQMPNFFATKMKQLSKNKAATLKSQTPPKSSDQSNIAFQHGMTLAANQAISSALIPVGIAIDEALAKNSSKTNPPVTVDDVIICQSLIKLNHTLEFAQIVPPIDFPESPCYDALHDPIFNTSFSSYSNEFHVSSDTLDFLETLDEFHFPHEEDIVYSLHNDTAPGGLIAFDINFGIFYYNFSHFLFFHITSLFFFHKRTNKQRFFIALLLYPHGTYFFLHVSNIFINMILFCWTFCFFYSWLENKPQLTHRHEDTSSIFTCNITGFAKKEFCHWRQQQQR